MAITPVKRPLKKSASTSGSSKMKQSSLMSFFKPAAPTTPSSPLRSKGSALKDDEDKENDSSMMEDITTDTPLTSETNNVPEKSGADPVLQSSPVKHQPEEKHVERVQKKPEAPKEVAPTPNGTTTRRDKKISYAESDASDDEDEIPSKRKRRRVVDSDDEDDFKPTEDVDDDDDDAMSDFVVNDEESDVASMDEDEEEEESQKSSRSVKRKKQSPKASLQSPASSSTTPQTSHLGSKFLASSDYKASVTAKQAPKPKIQKKSFAKENEERYQWLVNIKDAEKRTPDDPNYDSRTLFIPSSAWAKFTAFEKQYWEIKSKMWDTVVFFKKGKFYELYENDAVIANTKFDLKIAGGGRANMKLAGIPEMSFEYWAKEFISNGYKVAKVDQKESLLAKEMRGGGTKEEKIIKRELTGILTGGTLTDLDMISDDMATYCLSIKESTTEKGEKVFGACFVDTATSEVNFIELVDDEECSKLDTLITQIKPKEILCEKHNLCPAAVKIIKFSAHSSHQIWNHLNPLSEFLDYDGAVEALVKGKYYEANDLDDFSKYPATLLKFKDNHEVAFTAFGGMLFYLKMLKLDQSIMSLGNIKEYEISKSGSSHLLLDGITLHNLEILNNSFDGGDKGTLFKLLNRAITPFGRRMLKKWILYPLINIEEINARYDAVDFLMNEEPELRVKLESTLGSLPDLERLIARVHAKTLRFKDFLRVVESFEALSSFFKDISQHNLEKSGALKKFLDRFPQDIHALVESWEEAFDRQQAINNVVVPEKGVDKEFDESVAIMEDLESQLNEYLKGYKKQYKSHEICYRDSGKEIFLIEMPVKIKSIPKDWQQMGATSKVKRYWSPEVKATARQLMEQRELHKSVCENLISRMYERFDANYESWMTAIKIAGNIDCLIALTKTSETISYPSCRPSFLASGHAKIDIKDLRHPCFYGTKDFIPNDVVLGGDHANFNLLTGANAAGKSTLMRTSALAVVMSQIGCYLPASSAELTPVDKIMTRLGANDNIMQGKSTFFVELSETKKILSNATSNSLVILDELGRGGSSSDGYAIAESVLHHLATHAQPLGFFATHYGTMGLSFVNHPRIKPMRMGIIVDQNSRNITFLYKLEEGTASGSFGMNVAAMCGISKEIVDKAEVAAKDYEQTSKLRDEHEKQHISRMSIGLQSDFSWTYQNYSGLQESVLRYSEAEKQNALDCMFRMIESL